MFINYKRQMLLVSVPCQWWDSWYNKLNYIEAEMMTMAIYRLGLEKLHTVYLKLYKPKL